MFKQITAEGRNLVRMAYVSHPTEFEKSDAYRLPLYAIASIIGFFGGAVALALCVKGAEFAGAAAFYPAVIAVQVVAYTYLALGVMLAAGLGAAGVKVLYWVWKGAS